MNADKKKLTCRQQETTIDCLERELELSEAEAVKVIPPIDSMAL